MAAARVGLLLAAFSLAAAPSWAGVTWHVDDGAPCPGNGSPLTPFCTIQQALDAAASGDEIEVAPGLYAESIDFLGKDVALRSADGPATTIIEGSGFETVVSFVNGESRDAVLEGFTVRNGFAFFPDVGGGIASVNSSPTITGNVVELNGAEVGGGLALLGGSPLVSGNTIRDNTSTQGGGIHCSLGTTAHIVGNDIVSNGGTGTTGGGIDVVAAAALIEDNLIEGNVTSSGAGLSIAASPGTVVRGNVIRGNHTDEGDGGGLVVIGEALVEGNQIVENSAVNVGGGVYAYGGTFRGNRIAGNTAFGGGGAFLQSDASFDGDVIEDNLDSLFGGVVIDGGATVTLSRVVIRGHALSGATFIGGSAVLQDCLIVGNDQGLLVADTELALRRCTLSGNSSGGVASVDGSHVDVESCIVWENGASPALELFEDTGTIDASWSIVRGGFGGPGNLDADPLFADAGGGDYALLAGSPAIDGGDPADGVCAFDLSGSPRRLDGQLDVGAEVDRGALEFDHVRLATSSPGAGVLQITLTGASGLQSFLFAAPGAGFLRLEKWGAFGLDLGGPWVVAPWPGAPSSIQVHVAPAFAGAPIVLPALAGNSGQLGATGNLSNPVALALP